MRVPLSWLKEYVEVTESAESVDRTLTNAGLEVKTTTYMGLPGAELVWDTQRIRLSRLLRVEPHPNADKLVLATVEYGAAAPKTVVTGAPNLYPFVGQGDLSSLALYSPLALEGAEIYDGHVAGRKKMTLKGRPLRGIYNDAMLCSEKELGISEEHDGVILMEAGPLAPPYTPGAPLQEVLGDVVFEIEIIPNIARCASMLGVAREYAALMDRPLRYPDYSVVMDGPPIAGRVTIGADRPDLNPRFVALLISGVRQTPSPYWLQYRLRLAGQRPINVVVDVSNYVMLEMGQPNHTFDYAYLRQRADQYNPAGPVHIQTRLPQPGETLVTLDGVQRNLPDYTILVTDPAGALSLGGIMGGANSEIKPDTTDVLLEAAAWNFINIRRSRDSLDLPSEASFRFSRGVHPSQALLGAKRAAELLRLLAGGTVAQGIVDHYPAPPTPTRVRLNLDYARRLSGLDLTAVEMAALLERLEFTVDVQADHMWVVTPDHRQDIEGPHDVVEEICRVYGYDRIPSTLLAEPLPQQRGNHVLELEEDIKDSLIGQGFQEIISYRLTAPEAEARLYPGESGEAPTYVTLTNPISADKRVMRRRLLATMLEVAARNSRYQERLALCEIGPIFLPQPQAQLPQESAQLALLLAGTRERPHWRAAATTTYDFFDLKGVLEALYEQLKVSVRFEPIEHPTYRRGRTAAMWAGATHLGWMGELHPAVVENLGFRGGRDWRVLAAEIELTSLIELVPAFHAYRPLSAYPAVHEDLALVVDATLPAAQVAAVLAEAGGETLRQIELFDIYTGDQVPPGKKSLAYHLTFQSFDQTLSDKDTERLRRRLLKQAEASLGAILRA